MAPTGIVTQEAAVNRAAVLQTTLAVSKLRLVKTITPSVNVTRDTLVANECDFSGYTAGGYALTAWTGPAITAEGGGGINSPCVNVKVVAPGGGAPIVDNQITGGWIDTADGTILAAFAFVPAVTMALPTNQFTLLVTDAESAG